MGQLDDRVLARETRTVGARGLTSTDIARQAGVSQATVSRVLRGYSNVTSETRERVLEVLERTGYVPNALARAMVTRRTDTIGVVIDDLRNPFYPELFAGV